MKHFLKMVLAVVVGCFIAGIVLMLFSFSLIGSMAAIGSTTAPIPSDCVLNVDMSQFELGEQTIDDPFSSVQSIMKRQESAPVLGIYDAILALEHAATDPAVKFVYLKTDGARGGLAEVEEFRKALCTFRESGKPVFAFVESPTNGSYYLASAADKIYMSNYLGSICGMVGLSSQMFFLKDALDMLGVNMQLIRHGKFKSAGEMYIKNEISPENRMQSQEMVDAMWAGLAETMASARGLSTEQFNALIDGLALNCPEDFLRNGLVDELLTKEELNAKIAGLAGKEEIKDVKAASLLDYAAAYSKPNIGAKNGKIAVIYADGQIIDGNETKGVAGDRFAGIISKVRKDESVKAVVLRVSSPGGSVLAAEKIKTELDLLGEEKPLIASYGNYAASGGYWISTNCRHIFSNASTLTGSIGVFSMIPDFSKTAKNLLHVGVTTITSNKHSDLYSSMKPLDQEETAYMQASVEAIYDRFTTIVSEGRSLSKDYVDSVAQGRVWAGSTALGISLVDEIGTIEDAIMMAASLAEDSETPDLGKWEIASYPKPLSMIEQLMMQINGTGGEENVLAGTPFGKMGAVLRKIGGESVGKAYAMMPYIYDIK
ncbi:MAG: signal peptide peptidase SppA [Bacteroidales bacterium]|nr:signal peptide peptidase SppA [Bacteroidales bacterium]